MARSKRRAFKPRKRTRADWVYRPSLYIDDEGAVQLVNLGSYLGDRQVGLTPGINGVQTLILYDGTDFLAESTRASISQTGIQQGVLTRAARAEGKEATVLAVQGSIRVVPNGWAAGTRFDLGFRLGWFEQDDLSGLASVDPDYTMWDTGATTFETPAVMADQKTANIRTWRIHRGFNDTEGTIQVNIFWKGRRRSPSSKHGLMLWCETAPGSLTLNLMPNLRTLVVDEV